MKCCIVTQFQTQKLQYDLILTNYLCNDPISKPHFEETGVRASTYEFVGDTTQPLTTDNTQHRKMK